LENEVVAVNHRRRITATLMQNQRDGRNCGLERRWLLRPTCDYFLKIGIRGNTIRAFGFVFTLFNSLLLIGAFVRFNS